MHIVQLISTDPGRAQGSRRRAIALAIASLLVSGAAHAFDVPTGNSDLAIRWDNTIRYNLGFRTQSQDSNLLASPNFDDGDRNFKNGSIVTNRLDVISEFDFIYKKDYGFRISANGWYDRAAYQERTGSSACFFGSPR